MKRFFTILLILMVMTASVFASDFHFVFDRVDLNGTIIKKFSFCPAVAVAGVGYTGVTFIEGNTTEFQLIVGGGLENVKTVDYNEYSASGDYKEANTLMGTGKVLVKQGLLEDLITVYGGVELRYDKFKAVKDDVHDNDYTGFSAEEGMKYTLLAGATYNGMDDRMTTKDGIEASVAFKWAPKISKQKHFFGAEANVVYGETLYQILQANGLNMFAVGFMDRANAVVTTKDVSLAAQRTYSLGSKVRGFDRYEYNTTLAFANNFEFRLVSPELRRGLFARVIGFYDVGYAAGKVMGTEDKIENKFISSVGVQAHVSIYDFANVGIQYAYLLKGANPIKEKGEHQFVLHFTLVLAY